MVQVDMRKHQDLRLKAVWEVAERRVEVMRPIKRAVQVELVIIILPILRVYGMTIIGPKVEAEAE